MAQNYPLFKVFFTAFALAVLPQPVRAEVACIAEVSYRWVKEQSSPVEKGGSGVDLNKGATPGGAPSADSSAAPTGAPSAGAPPERVVPGEQKVRFAQVERRGQDERAAKAGLQIEVNRQKARAYERCKRDHESFGDCVSTKMSTKVATLNSLSFSARSKVEEALIDECRVEQGRCVSIDSDEPTCRDLSAVPASAGPETTDRATGAAKAEGGDKKGSAKEAAKPAEPASSDKSKPAKKKP
jgi:hypothetical protein